MVLRRLLYYISVFIKGLCVGATGILQGISGGSMALLLGAHQELVSSLHSVDGKALRLLKDRNKSTWLKHINSNFLFAILVGIITGIVTLRVVFRHYVGIYPIFISSFFFSLVSIAAFLLLRKITRWNIGVVFALLAGFAITYSLTRIAPFSTPNHVLLALPTGFLAGATLIIPGVSDSFILMFVGKYRFILTSFGSLEIDVIILFIAGGILGLIFTARLLAGLLSKFYNFAVGLFAGLMIGSLNKIWPWREVLEYATTVEGKRIPTFDSSILPWRYLEITGKDPQVFYAILMMAAGVFIVVLVEKFASRRKTNS